MSKHTPGPWSYDRGENEVHSDSMQETGGDPAHICEMLGANIETNARLIAAAPDMLEALKSVVLTMGQKHDFVLLESMVKAAAEAIAKAEGRS